MIDQIDLNSVEIFNSMNPKDWKKDCNITKVSINNQGQRGNTIIEFDKKDGPNRWPDFQPAWSARNELMQYCIWLFLNVNGKWFGSGFIQCWYGRDGSGDNPRYFKDDWYYALDRWRGMFGHQIQIGEEIGFMVTNHDDRNNGSTGNEQRSNTVKFKISDNFQGEQNYEEQFTPIAKPPEVSSGDLDTNELLRLIVEDVNAIRQVVEGLK